MAETVQVNLDELTVGDLADFEDYVGRDLFDVLPKSDTEGWRPPAKALVALVWLTRRKADPTFTVDQARQVKVSELELAADPPAEPPA